MTEYDANVTVLVLRTEIVSLIFSAELLSRFYYYYFCRDCETRTIRYTQCLSSREKNDSLFPDYRCPTSMDTVTRVASNVQTSKRLTCNIQKDSIALAINKVSD